MLYVDETGDRGFGPRSSPFFAMTPLMVPQEDDWTVKVAAGGLRALIHQGHPESATPLHWVRHFRSKWADRRGYAAQALALMPSAKVIHVIAPKGELRAHPELTDGAAFYNHVTRLLLERVARAAEHAEGHPRLAVVRLGAVRGVNHAHTVDYLTRVREESASEVPWERMKWPPVWVGSEWDGVQLADLHAGFLNAALPGAPDEGDSVQNLLRCKEQLYRPPGGEVLGHGVHVLGADTSFVTRQPWWPKWSAS